MVLTKSEVLDAVLNDVDTVFVYSANGVALDNTKRINRVKDLLKNNKAKIISINPCTIQLTESTTEYAPQLFAMNSDTNQKGNNNMASTTSVISAVDNNTASNYFYYISESNLWNNILFRELSNMGLDPNNLFIGDNQEVPATLVQDITEEDLKEIEYQYKDIKRKFRSALEDGSVVLKTVVSDNSTINTVLGFDIEKWGNLKEYIGDLIYDDVWDGAGWKTADKDYDISNSGFYGPFEYQDAMISETVWNALNE